MINALEGTVVLDFTTEFWAALAAAFLGDFGATVLRIENTSEARRRNPDRDGQHPPADWDYRSELIHRNKRSLGIDLEQERGREILREMVSRADVFHTDLCLGELEEKGLDYASLSTIKPDLVYSRGSGFGPKGPDKDLPPLDELAAARAGMMPILPQPGQPPVYPDSGHAYTTVMLAFGIVTALLHRAATGEGQQVDASLFAGNLYGASLDLQAFLATDAERYLQPVSRLDAGNPMGGAIYPSQDGRWVTLTMPDTDRSWPGFSKLVGLDPDDPRFDNHERRCGENRLVMIEVLEEAIGRQPGSHWKTLFDENQISADVIETFSYPVNDEQVYRNHYILELDHSSLGKIKSLGFPIYLSESPAHLDRTAPCRGQHSAMILHEVLGYDQDRIADLEAQGIIA